MAAEQCGGHGKKSNNIHALSGIRLKAEQGADREERLQLLIFRLRPWLRQRESDYP